MLDVTPCPHCGHAEENTHWNPPGTLALVDSELLIKIPAGTRISFEKDDPWTVTPLGVPILFDRDDPDAGAFINDAVLRATRTEYLRDKQGDMTYQLTDGGGMVVGKFHWTHR